jgi:hypothetical protein
MAWLGFFPEPEPICRHQSGGFCENALLNRGARQKNRRWPDCRARGQARFTPSLTDIFRLVEAHPHLRPLLPEAVLARLDE